MVLTLNDLNPLDVFLKQYVDYFRRGGFETVVVRVSKFTENTYQQGGLYLFMGNATILPDSKTWNQELSVGFGDLLSVRGGEFPFTLVSQDKKLYVLHFLERRNYEQLPASSYNHSDGSEGEGPRDSVGLKTGFWREESEEFTGEGQYLNGQRVGVWKVGLPEGNNISLSLVGPYVNGERNGHWVEIEDGYKEEGDYLRGKKTGLWISTAEDGSFSRKGNYYNDLKEGVWEFQSVREFEGETIPILKVQRYHNGKLV